MGREQYIGYERRIRENGRGRQAGRGNILDASGAPDRKRLLLSSELGIWKITTVDTVFARFVIDFQSKSGHTMDLAFAAESLKPIPATTFMPAKFPISRTLRQMAALHHLDLIKLVLQSFGGRATVDQIQQVLVPDVIKDDWKKWWEAAKRELKKDGHFQVPVKKSDPSFTRPRKSRCKTGSGGIPRRQRA